ncbi:MAG TPA: polyprenyl synthetase family protein, partial [Thermoanaerobaculia bacterium]|nr:polyprenyl synthetase family protein [Thermoanaerobaculia bacterium]
MAEQRRSGHALTAADARAGWMTARAIGRVAEGIAELPESRAILRGLAHAIGPRTTTCAASIFGDWARDAAEAFGDADAASMMFAPLGALIEGIRIIDDVQDEEEVCLPPPLAYGAFARALELTSELPLADASWRAATIAIGRGLRETAIGQELETTATGEFSKFWEIVDGKTAPLVATAFELGALAAGATPDRAAALKKLAVPFGRMLQIGDDCNDALGPDASDWRKPQLNLLMLSTLSGPRGAELTTLLRESLPDAKLLLLRDGALAYALHAQLTTIAEAAEVIRELALPNPAP